MKRANKGLIIEKTIPKTFTLTKKDLESIILIKNRYINKKIPLTDSAIVRIALDITLKAEDDILFKHFAEVKKIPLGRKKSIDTKK